MANNGWYFNPMSRKHKQSSNDDFRSAFKSNKDLAEAILREFDQNAGDAATGRSPRQIRICFRTISPSVISKYLNGSAEQGTLADHLVGAFEKLAERDPARKMDHDKRGSGIIKRASWWTSPEALIIEDYDTSGLLGSHERSRKKEEENSDLYNFLYTEGEQQKQKNAKGGTHGRGKIVFSLASSVSTFFGMTCRNGVDGEEEHVCFGKMEFPSPYFTDEETEYNGSADWGDISVGDGKDVFDPSPAFGNAVAEEFISDFGFERNLGEPGLSLCIPWLRSGVDDNDEPMNWTHMFKAIVENLSFVIFDKTLEVILEDQNHSGLESPIKLTAESLYGEFIQREHLWEDSNDETTRLSRRSQMTLYRDAADKFNSEPDMEMDLDGVDYQSMDGGFLKEEFADIVEKCRSILAIEGQVARVHVKLPVPRLADRKEVKDEFDLFLKNCTHDLPRHSTVIGKSFRKNYQRQELAIHGARPNGAVNWDRMMMLVHLDSITREKIESPLHQLMKTCEFANHKWWDRDETDITERSSEGMIFDLLRYKLADALYKAMYEEDEEDVNYTLMADLLPLNLGGMLYKTEEEIPPEGRPIVITEGGTGGGGSRGLGRPFDSLKPRIEAINEGEDNYYQISIEPGQSAEPVKEFYLKFGYDDGTDSMAKNHQKEDFDFLNPAEDWKTNFYGLDGCTYEIVDERTIKVIFDEGKEQCSIRTKRGLPAFETIRSLMVTAQKGL